MRIYLLTLGTGLAVGADEEWTALLLDQSNWTGKGPTGHADGTIGSEGNMHVQLVGTSCSFDPVLPLYNEYGGGGIRTNRPSSKRTAGSIVGRQHDRGPVRTVRQGRRSASGR